MAGEHLSVIQLLPALDAGGVERGTVEVARALTAAGHRAIVVAAGGRLAPSLVEVGAEHLAWPIGRKSALALRFVPRLRRLFAESRADVVHARSRLPAWLGYLAWRTLDVASRPRFVTTVHGFYSVNRYSAIMTRGERVIAVSESIRRYVLEHYPGVAPERVVLIPRGIDRREYPHGFRPDAQWTARWTAAQPDLAGAAVLVLPGRLTRLKGHEDLVELVARLRARGRRVRALVVGGASPRHRRYETALRERIAAAGLGDAVRLLGDRADLREIMASASIVLSLSRQPESFGRTVLEALSLGTPAVGYAHGGVGEILERIYPAGRAPPGDLDTLVERVGTLLDRPEPVPASDEYALEHTLDATLDLYGRLAGERGGGL